MGESKADDWFKLPAVGVIALIAAVVGHIWKTPVPYVDERPGFGATGTLDQPAAQDVEARLWQDPFSAQTGGKGQATGKPAAIAITLQTGKPPIEMRLVENNPATTHSHRRIYAEWDLVPTCRLTVVAALLPGGKYAEEVEARQRQRYALLSALAARGFAPADAEHLGYFDPDDTKTASGDKPQRVWFEWFATAPNPAQNCRQGSTDRALVLWVNDARFGDRPVARLLKLLEQASPRANGKKMPTTTRYAVIGPNQSAQLAALVKEALAGDPWQLPADAAATPANVEFFPAMATAAEPVLLGDYGDRCRGRDLARCLLETRGLRLFRTTPDDAELSRALVAELKLRKVVPGNSQVVLLSEWDSLYGRELPKTFAKAFAGDDDGGIHRYSYVRGIDGKLPGKSDKGDAAPEAPRDAAGKRGGGALERPEGQSQKDYLRRLVATISEQEQQGKERCNYLPGCEIAAIGVLGYDIYDKLTILQALRERFPGKIFFTTDLDAAYLHPSEQPYTHNVVVASGFDLRLRNEIQRDIPPFRDSFQTAVFYSVLLAMQHASEGATAAYPLNARVFEIGRRQHVALNLTGFPAGSPTQGCTPATLEKCGNFHPPAAQRWSLGHFILLALALVSAAMLAARMSWTVRDLLSHKFALPAALPWPRRLSVGMLVAAGTVALAVLAASCPYFRGNDGEPFYWMNGVSIWPSELLRLLALATAAALLYLAWQRIESNRLGGKGTHAKPGYIEAYALPQAHRSPDWRPPQDVNEWKHPPMTADGLKVDAGQLLVEYRQLGTWKLRTRRSLVNWFWFMAFGAFVTFLWGVPHSPARGDAAFLIDRLAIVFTATMVVFLTVWIGDAARLCHRMIRHLADHPSQWPDSTLKKFARELAMREEDIEDWLDAKFIAAHTAVVQKLVWYPVIPLLLLMLARNAVFDDWDFPPSLIVTFGLNLAYTFSCLFVLQAGAKDARKETIRLLTSKLDILHGAKEPDSRRIAQVTELRRQAIELREGAFEPLHEQPMFKALLTLLGGGGLAMTDLVGFFG